MDNHQEKQGHFPSPAPTINARLLVLRIKVFPFTKPPEQDYIWKMTSRRLGDISVTESIDYLVDDHTPLANISEVEKASCKYYGTEAVGTPPRGLGSDLAYRYPRKDIQ